MIGSARARRRDDQEAAAAASSSLSTSQASSKPEEAERGSGGKKSLVPEELLAQKEKLAALLEKFFHASQQEDSLGDLRHTVAASASRLHSTLSRIGSSLLNNHFKHLYQKPVTPFGSSLPLELNVSDAERKSFAEEIQYAPEMERKIASLISDVQRRTSEDEEAMTSGELCAHVVSLLDELRVMAVATLPSCAIASQLSGEDRANKEKVVLNCLESHVMASIHKYCFSPTSRLAEEDARVKEKLDGLSAFLSPSHLEISEAYGEEMFLEHTRELLFAINAAKTPLKKLVALLMCFKALYKEIESKSARGGQVGADELLPLLIYAIAKANPPCLASNVEYISKFRHPELMVAESAYYFMTFAGAVTFLTQVEASSLAGGDDEDDTSDVEEDAGGKRRTWRSSSLLDNSKRRYDPFRFVDRTADTMTEEEVRDLLVIYSSLVRQYVPRKEEDEEDDEDNSSASSSPRVSSETKWRSSSGTAVVSPPPSSLVPRTGEDSEDWAAFFPRFNVKLARAIPPSPIVHVGFLLKYRSGQLVKQQWQPRFFVLLNTPPKVSTKDVATSVQHSRKGTLRWFEDAECFECVNCMDLSAVIGIYHHAASQSSPGPTFTLESANRTITLCAQTDSDCKTWVGKLANLLSIEPEFVKARKQ